MLFLRLKLLILCLLPFALSAQEESSEFEQDYKPWLISTNLFSPLAIGRGWPRGFRLFDNGLFSSPSLYFFSSTVDVSIEPEYLITPKLSLGLPTYFGLTRQSLPDETNESSAVVSGYTDPAIHASTYRYKNATDPYVRPTPERSSQNYNRRKDLIFQTGLQLKYFPWGQRERMSPFLGAIANIGQLDVYAVDTYHHLDTALNEWYLKGGKTELRKNPFFYFRGEFMLGLKFHFKGCLGLQFSTGVATGVQYNGKNKDRLYVKHNDGPYELSVEDHMNISVANALWFNRLHVFYAFGGKKNYSRTKCPKVKPFKESRVGYYRFALSTNLSSVYRFSSWERQQTISANPMVTIEPEVFFGKRYSVKLIAGIGLSYNSRGEEFSGEQKFSSTFEDTLNLWIGPWNYINNNTPSELPEFDTGSLLKSELHEAHSKELNYEIGVQPKYYFTASNNVLAPYVGVGLYYGRMNAYKTSYYHTFDTTYVGLLYGSQVVDDTLWQTTDAHYTSESAPFNYFRAQLLTGINLNVASFVSLGTEIAYSTPVKNKGPEDEIYARHEGGEYTLQHSRSYEYNRIAGHFAFRVYAIIHIGKKKCNRLFE